MGRRFYPLGLYTTIRGLLPSFQDKAMSLPRADHATQIADHLNVLAAIVKTRSRASLTDANRILETIAKRLFNALFGWDLVNLNTETSNFPAVDLGDRARRIAIQVTNEGKAGKIRSTADKAIKHQLGGDFDRLIVFFLLPRKPGSSKKSKQPASGLRIESWDIPDLLKQMLELSSVDALHNAAQVLKQELGQVAPDGNDRDGERRAGHDAWDQTGSGTSNARSLTALHEKVDLLLSARGKALTEENIAREAFDEDDNCRLRAAALHRLREDMEFEQAAALADKSEVWLSRTNVQSTVARAELLERLADEAIIRFRRHRDGAAPGRSGLAERLRGIAQSIEELLSLLNKTACLKATGQLAYIESLLVSADAGLVKLDGRSDVFALRRRLAILVDAGRHAEGLDLIRGVQPAVEWVDKAMLTALGCADWAEVERLLAWAKQAAPPTVRRTCDLLVVESVVLSRAQEARPAAVPSEDHSRCEWAFGLLAAAIAEVTALSEPRHEMDAYVLRLGLHLAVALGKAKEVRQFAVLLSRRTPLDLVLGLLATRGHIIAESDWPQRFRTEGHWSFDRQLVATALEAEDSARRPGAFRAAVRLAERVTTDEERKRLHGLLMQIAQGLGDEERQEFDKIAPSLVDANDRVAQMWAVGQRLASRDNEGAEKALVALRDDDDPLWLQLHGQLLLRQQKVAEGVQELAKAARRIDDVGLLSEVSGLALSHRQWDVAVDLLERLLSLKPTDSRAKSGLAMSLFHREEFERAGELFLEIANDHSDGTNSAVTAAGCFIQAGRPSRAIDVLSKVCEAPTPSLRAVVTLAQLLVEHDDAKGGFALMNRHKEQFWERFEFVSVYWGIAYAAEDESAGHEGFVQVQYLQSKGAAPADAIVAKTLDDILEMGKEYDQRQLALAIETFKGRLPWLVAAQWQREPAFRAWAQRTSERKWVLERPQVIAQSCIYATNGFTPQISGNSRHLVPIEGSAPRQPIVVDLSALVTLQQLGLTESAAAYAGRMHVPQSYLFRMFVDHDRLRPHQPSRKTVVAAVRLAMTSGKVHAEEQGAVVKRVDEHHPREDQPAGVYHLKDLAEGLKTAGVVADSELTKLSTVSHRPITTSAVHAPLAIGDHLLISLSTLSTLHYSGLLTTVFEHFRVSITGEDRDIVFGESAWFEGQEKLRSDHRKLWDFVLNDPRIERKAGIREPETLESDVEDARRVRPESVAVDSLALAEQLGLPLLADDRVIQVHLFNKRPHTASAAFSVAQLISSMADAQHITREEQARCIGQLMEWRYRFIVPEFELLLFWARRSMASPPGPNLRVLARYLHDSLRDPGLFGGFEATDPPTTMAGKLHQQIEMTVGDFVGELWRDSGTTEALAEMYTKWSVANLLPSPPTSMEPSIRIMSGLRYPLFVSIFLSRIARTANTERSRRGAECLRKALGLRPRVFARRVVETIDGLASGSD